MHSTVARDGDMPPHGKYCTQLGLGVTNLEGMTVTHRPPSSSFLWFIRRIFKVIPKKELGPRLVLRRVLNSLLRGLWAGIWSSTNLFAHVQHKREESGGVGIFPIGDPNVD